jgi:hypothetical protein
VQAYTQTAASELAIDPDPLWLQTDALPPPLQEKLDETGTTLTLQQWARLSPLQRFVLIKLSRSNHENKNFLPALQEFGIKGNEEIQIEL